MPCQHIGLCGENGLNPAGATGQYVKSNSIGVANAQSGLHARCQRGHLIRVARAKGQVAKIMGDNDEVQRFRVYAGVFQGMRCRASSQGGAQLFRIGPSTLPNLRDFFKLLNDDFVGMGKRLALFVVKVSAQKGAVRYDLVR